jgi:hypothetical protein
VVTFERPIGAILGSRYRREVVLGFMSQGVRLWELRTTGVGLAQFRVWSVVFRSVGSELF